MKSLFKIMVVCLTLLMAVSFAYAGNGKGKCFGKGVRDGSGLTNTTGVTRPNYVDKNGDGICDNSGAKIAGTGYDRILGYGRGYGKGKGYGASKRGRGIRDGSGPINKASTARPNFVDENGDGICDNAGVRTPKN